MHKERGTKSKVGGSPEVAPGSSASFAIWTRTRSTSACDAFRRRLLTVERLRDTSSSRQAACKVPGACSWACPSHQSRPRLRSRCQRYHPPFPTERSCKRVMIASCGHPVFYLAGPPSWPSSTRVGANQGGGFVCSG